jgi:hypothetical protein
MMEATNTSETSVNLYQTTRRNNPEDIHLHTHRRCEPQILPSISNSIAGITAEIRTVILLLKSERYHYILLLSNVNFLASLMSEIDHCFSTFQHNFQCTLTV